MKFYHRTKEETWEQISMLRRKTWHICKCNNMLNAHLKIYKFFSNYFMKKWYWEGSGDERKRIARTPAMHLGILDTSITIGYLYNHL